jgi:hypothetical protein
MKTVTTILLAVLVAAPANAGLMDRAKELSGKAKEYRSAPASEPDSDTTSAGLKEALSVGAQNAVAAVAKLDGYYANPSIKIPLPRNVQKASKILSKVGLKKQAEQFVVSMNRAAERAAPQAADIFLGAVKKMTFTDARKILQGNDTAAMEYLKGKTYDRLLEAFKPTVSTAMNEVGVTKQYKELMRSAAATGLVKEEATDLDRYVTGKALDGLFFMVGEEEKKIRKDPAARVTELLRTVFGSSRSR